MTGQEKNWDTFKVHCGASITCIQMVRDQLNSRFHGRDIFREIGLLPWKTPISVKSVIFC